MLLKLKYVREDEFPYANSDMVKFVGKIFDTNWMASKTSLGVRCYVIYDDAVRRFWYFNEKWFEKASRARCIPIKVETNVESK